MPISLPPRLVTIYLSVGLLWLAVVEFGLDSLGLAGFTAVALRFALNAAFVVVTAWLLQGLIRQKALVDAGRDHEATERLRTETALRENEELFRSTFELAAVGLAHTALSGQFLRVNSHFADITAYSQDELPGLTYQQLTHPEDLDTSLEFARQLMVGERSRFTQEKRYVRKDGVITWVRLTIAMRRDSTGQPLHYITVAEDIADRKRAELELQEARRILRLVLDSIPIGVFWKNRDSMYLGCNQIVARASGVGEPDQIIGLYDRDLPTITAEEGEFFVRKDREVMESGQPQLQILEPMTRPTGETTWLSTNKVPMRDENGEVFGVLGTWEDVTERRRTEEKLWEHERLLQQVTGAARVGLVVVGEAYVYLFANEAYAELFGLTSESIIGRFVFEILPEGWKVIQPNLERAFRGERVAYQLSMPARPGKAEGVRYYQALYEPRRDSKGKRSVVVVVVDITEQKRAELQEKELRSRLTAAMESMSNAVFISDLDGRFIEFNEAFATIHRFPSKSECARTLAEYPDILDVSTLEGELLPLDQWAMTRALRGERGTGVEFRLRRKDSGESWIGSYNYAPIRDASGTILGAVVVGRDVTVQKQVEQSLRQSEARFRNLIDFLPDPVSLNSEGLIRYVNQACLRLLGATEPHQLLGKTPFEIIHPTYHELVKQRIEQMRVTGTSMEGFDEELVRLDGVRVPVHVNAMPIPDEGREAFLVVYHDLTERRKVEGQLRQQEMLLREASELAHVGGWGFDPVTLEPDWTSEVARIYDMPEFDPPSVAEALTYYVPEQRTRLEEALAAAINFGTPHDLELKLITPKGHVKWVRTICRPIIVDGKVVRVRGSLQEITDRKLLEEQFRQAQKMEAIGRLAGGIAHDFNNLLTVINGYSEMALQGVSADDPNCGAIVAIRDAGERAASLTAQLLAFSRKAVVQPKVIDLREVLQKSEQLLRRLIGEDITLVFQAPLEPCRIEADPNQIDQVVMNLIVNARDAMPKGGRLTIELARRCINQVEPTLLGNLNPGCYVELMVSDTGCGMTEDVRAQIFEPFFTTKGVGKGTGLGLAVVHGIVLQAGGGIHIESRLREGTRFRLLFPETVLDRVASIPTPTTQVTGGFETVLLVEDEDSVRLLSRITLESQGYTVLTANSGMQALQMLEDAVRIDVLVTDLVMPGMNGRELAETLRMRYPWLRVLFVSGYSEDMIAQQSQPGHETAFLAKPFTPFGLARMVREVLDTTR